MSLTVFRARWFSTVDWGWNEAELLANDTEEVRRWVEQQTPTEHRMRSRSGRTETDSLSITATHEVETLPYVLSRRP